MTSSGEQVSIADITSGPTGYEGKTVTVSGEYRADFDRNGIVDISDFGLLALNFMKYSPVGCTD